MLFGTEIGLLRKEPYLLGIRLIKSSPHLDGDPSPSMEAGYSLEHHTKYTQASYIPATKTRAILGYASDSGEKSQNTAQVDLGKAARKNHRQ